MRKNSRRADGKGKKRPGKLGAKAATRTKRKPPLEEPSLTREEWLARLDGMGDVVLRGRSVKGIAEEEAISLLVGGYFNREEPRHEDGTALTKDERMAVALDSLAHLSLGVADSLADERNRWGTEERIVDTERLCHEAERYS